MKFDHLQSSNFNKKTGFTLIESLVVLTMMMVMMAAGVSSYTSANKKNRDNKRLADLEKVRMALEMFRQNDIGGSYPSTGSALVPNYLEEWPVGPRGSGVGDTYLYTRTTYFTYILRTNLETTGVGYSLTNP